MIRRPPRSTQSRSSAASDVYKRQSHAFSSSRPPPTDRIVSIIVGWVTGVTGTCANAVVLIVLIFARRHYGSHVNTLIANQSAMDLFACIFLVIGFGIMMIPGAPKYDFGLGEVGNNVVCYLFESRVLTVSLRNAGIIGLVMIYVDCKPDAGAKLWYVSGCL